MSETVHPPEIETAAIEFWQIKPILTSVSEQVDIDRILRRLGLPDGLNGTPASTELDLTVYFRIQRDIARALDDLTLHLSARKLTYETGDFVLEQMKQALTLQDAMECLCNYFNMMHGDSYNSVRQREETLTLVVDDSSFPYTLKDDGTFTHFVGDCVLIKVHCLLDSLSHGLAMQALKRVSVQRDRNDPGSRQNQFWDVPVAYNKPVYELVYDFELASTPITPPEDMDFSTDGIFARVIGHMEQLQPVLDSRSFKARTRELIQEGYVEQGKAARQLGISVATLRRRLGAEQTSFRDLINEVRLERAKAMLLRGRSVNQVSDELEYSDIRAFNRAFKKWTGQTPSAFAKTLHPS